MEICKAAVYGGGYSMRYYNLILETIGPVHIGSGTEISKKECLYDTNNKKIYVMDEKMMFTRILALGKQDRFERYLLDSRQNNLFDFINENHISPEEYKSWAAYVLDDDSAVKVKNTRKNGGGSDNVQAFMKDAYGYPYIPGSSLKGALRTIIQGTLLNDDMPKFKSERNDIETSEFNGRTKYLSKTEKDIAKKLFYTLDRPDAKPNNAVNDCFSGIRISDSEPLSVSDIILCRKTDVFTDGEEKSLPIKRECLRPRTKVRFTLEIDERLFDIDSDELFRCMDRFYDIYANAYLAAFGADASYIPKNGEHIMYLGGGSGYATKTTVYPMYDGEEEIDRSVKTVQKIMVNVTPPKHKHRFDYENYEVSPHTLKTTMIGGKRYEMGLCRVDIRPK